MPVCKYFPLGTCQYGPSCLYSHDTGITPSAIVTNTSSFDKPPTSSAIAIWSDENTRPQACVYFLQGRCRKGKKCQFSHLPIKPTPQEDIAAATTPNFQVCLFFSKGSCRYGAKCRFSHLPVALLQSEIRSAATLAKPSPLKLIPVKPTFVNSTVAEPIHSKSILASPIHFKSVPSTPVPSTPSTSLPTPTEPTPEQTALSNSTPEKVPLANPTPVPNLITASPSVVNRRSAFPCTCAFGPGRCQSSSCHFTHAIKEQTPKNAGYQTFVADKRGVQEVDNDFKRTFAKYIVQFHEGGHVAQVTTSTEFSIACIKGLLPGTSQRSLLTILEGFGFDIPAICIQIRKFVNSSDVEAIVKVDDQFFAAKLAAVMKQQSTNLSTTQILISTQQSNSKTVTISWHKSSRSVWVNYARGKVATRVSEKFNARLYSCLGHFVTSSSARKGTWKLNNGGINHFPCTIILSNVPSKATKDDVQAAITTLGDKPGNIVMGPSSYEASNEEVIMAIRSRLEEYGPVKSFDVSAIDSGKQIKATAVFAEEADAIYACSLNNMPLEILKGGKCSIARVHSAKIKIPMPVYDASMVDIGFARQTWKAKFLKVATHQDPMTRFTTMEVEGNTAEDITDARKTLNRILAGTALMHEDNFLWSSVLNTADGVRKIKSIQRDLDVLITKDTTNCQLRYYGPERLLQEVTQHATSAIYELKRPISIRKPEKMTGEQDTIAKGDTTPNLISLLDIASSEVMCAACYNDQPDTPTLTTCNHTYCLECFENFCISAAPRISAGVRIQCQGNGGLCMHGFNLTELKDSLSSKAFELVLKISFENHMKRQ